MLSAKGNQRNLESEISGYVQDDNLRKTMDCARKTERKVKNGTIISPVANWSYFVMPEWSGR